jgi:hypothetical protein
MTLHLRLWMIAAVIAVLEGSASAAAGPASAAAEAAPADATPAPESAADVAFNDARRLAKRAKKRDGGAGVGDFSRGGCMNDPKQCICQSEDERESSACGEILGYFCPDSTQRLLMAQCVNLFGGATMCKCASRDEVNAQIARDDAEAAAAAAAAAKKAKKKSSKPKK